MTTRIKQLDILRGVAILLVLGRHFPYSGIYTGFGDLFFKLWKKVGWVGVDLFFVLSGFLVSGLLFREYQVSGKINLPVFLVRRGFKIYPAYYFLIFLTILLNAIYFHQVVPAGIIWSQLLFVQNYFGWLWPHTWTLAVEEHFYLFIGILLFLASKTKSTDPFRILVRIFVFIATGCLILRLFNSLTYWEGIFVDQRFLYPTHLRIDSLMFGVFLSYFHHFHYSGFHNFVTKNRHIILCFGAVFLLPVFIFELVSGPFIHILSLTLNYLGFGGLMMVFLYCFEIREGGGNKYDFLARIGFYSYSIYLWHFPILRWIIIPVAKKTMSSNTDLLIIMLAYFILTIYVGIWMARLIEIPFLKYRDKVCPKTIY